MWADGTCLLVSCNGGWDVSPPPPHLFLFINTAQYKAVQHLSAKLWLLLSLISRVQAPVPAMMLLNFLGSWAWCGGADAVLYNQRQARSCS